MPLPRLTKAQKARIVQALLDSANENFPCFDNHASRRGPYVITSVWDGDPLTGERKTVFGPGPVVVDTRDYSVSHYGSVPSCWPEWFDDDTLPRGKVKLAEYPIGLQKPQPITGKRMNVTDWVRSIGEAGLATRADIKSFMRADEIDEHDISPLQSSPEVFHAQVLGTYPYLVSIMWQGSSESVEPVVSCTCPVSEDWCKHVVAEAKLLQRDPGWEMAPGDSEMTNALLLRMTKHELLKLVTGLRRKHPWIEPTVTTLAAPHWYGQSSSMLKVQDALKQAFETSGQGIHPYSIDKVAGAWNYAVHAILSAYEKSNGYEVLSALETLIMEVNEIVVKQALPVDQLVKVIELACMYHARICGWLKPSSQYIRNWLLTTYFEEGDAVPTRLHDYAEFLDEEDLELMLIDAHEHVPLHPEEVWDLDCAVAIELDDVERLEALMEGTTEQDLLFTYYDDNFMFAEAQALLERALDPEDPVELSPDLRREAAESYFEGQGELLFFQHRFLVLRDAESFSYYLTSEGAQYAEVMRTLDDVGSPPNFQLLAATHFDRFDDGLELIYSSSPPSLSYIDYFAEELGVRYDPEWAVGLMFDHVKQVIRMVLADAHSSMREAHLINAIGRTLEIKQMIEHDYDAYLEWYEQMTSLKNEFVHYPSVLAALDEWGI